MIYVVFMCYLCSRILVVLIWDPFEIHIGSIADQFLSLTKLWSAPKLLKFWIASQGEDIHLLIQYEIGRKHIYFLILPKFCLCVKAKARCTIFELY